MAKAYYEDGMPKQSDCTHPGYSLVDGNLVCCVCGAPSTSEKWRTNLGIKAVEQKKTENKAIMWPPESKRKGK